MKLPLKDGARTKTKFFALIADTPIVRIMKMFLGMTVMKSNFNATMRNAECFLFAVLT